MNSVPSKLFILILISVSILLSILFLKFLFEFILLSLLFIFWVRFWIWLPLLLLLLLLLLFILLFISLLFLLLATLLLFSKVSSLSLGNESILSLKSLMLFISKSFLNSAFKFLWISILFLLLLLLLLLLLSKSSLKSEIIFFWVLLSVLLVKLLLFISSILNLLLSGKPLLVRLFLILLLLLLSLKLPKSFEPLFILSFSKSTTFSSTVTSKFAMVVFNPSFAFNSFLSVFCSNSLSVKLLLLSTTFKFEVGTDAWAYTCWYEPFFESLSELKFLSFSKLDLIFLYILLWGLSLREAGLIGFFKLGKSASFIQLKINWSFVLLTLFSILLNNFLK